MAEAETLDTDVADMKVIGVWVHGSGVIHSDVPITTTDDRQGLDLRPPTHVTRQLVGALGANPVGMPMPQMAEALARGVVGGAIVPWEVAGAIRFSEFVSNHTGFEGPAPYTAVFPIAMNGAEYDALPDGLKAIIDVNSGLEFSAEVTVATAAVDAGPRQAAVDRGNNIIGLMAEQSAEWQAAAEPTIRGLGRAGHDWTASTRRPFSTPPDRRSRRPARWSVGSEQDCSPLPPGNSPALAPGTL